ncbi:MAG: xanthine dehydrogenase family protein subunit M [Nitriliruptoraceae bacterium]|nr:xanthine dehydrogenase family protein subunit M [Nitriliruptoraceae bacterium]
MSSVMDPTKVTYLRPTSVAEAVDALRTSDGARPIAGGTDLMVQVRLGRRRPDTVVDLSAVDGLAELSEERIGAGVTMRRLLASEHAAAAWPALVEAARLLGGRQIQAMATVGGNLCNASPAAESATPLLVHDATARIAGPDCVRAVPLEEFWSGPGQTVLGPGELLIAVTLPATAGRSAYRRIELRRSVDIAVVSAAARLEIVDGAVAQARVAIGAAAPTPRRVVAAEQVLEGVAVGPDLERAINQAAVLAGDACVPIDDTRATARYRTAMIPVLVSRALAACVP